MEDAQDFLDDYDNMYETIYNLYWHANNKDLKKEMSDLLGILREDFGKQRDEAEEFLEKQYEEEMDYMNAQYEKDKF